MSPLPLPSDLAVLGPRAALAGAGVLAGLALARLPADLGFGVVAVVALAALALVAPLAGVAAMLVLSPLRALIATEAPAQFPVDVGQVTLALALGAAVLHLAAARRLPLTHLRSPLFVPLLGFVAAAGLSVLGAYSTTAWLTEWLKWLEMLALVALVLVLGRAGGWQWLVAALTLAGVANALVGLYEFFGGSGALHLLVNGRYFRAFGTFGQPNPFGGFLGLLAPLAVAMTLGWLGRLWAGWRGARRLDRPALVAALSYGSASALLAAGVLASWSRGAWLAFALSLAVVAFALPRRAWHSAALLGAVVAVGLLLWGSGRLPSSISERIGSATRELFAFDDVRGVDISPENYAVVERLAHWQAALGMARARPWLGVGLGNYEVAYPDFRLINWKFPLGHAHNFYLNVFAETGIIGLICYVALWASVIVITWRARRHPDMLARSALLGLLGTWAYFAVHSMTDNLLVNNLFLHLGVMLGILAVLSGEARGSARVRMR